ncbi:hypothetical protein A2630_01775 [Candidatus Woesebacteria bacterium RIFCSPHIGHO2_01_FULL_44_10]|uniref:Uncharacterized protein n=1 Tax=Candidatus Woesebacteria bacterium RIFCSPLOWO2_01_FULL_44_14 TaxID=1802525 RepID=A0A1F8C133_9BACT|nr:MAG: hypothetical protein A2630_01775 [Candidatus Woesebacteria bacterium RIFCSPHIGHO2_01_FULL_44_10]OGM54014.1 MAG: hypothetical protein A3F62_00405 [Candidatus Woesebacteria bacterium RIFCSPHIGHO2_12_FULL_44_11]OGM69982.1 MAG: hypothetical protein A2975_05245 [Candidatus Woesebacteria bacterium RIFCSPLOWO2_01_FULL_44_14]
MKKRYLIFGGALLLVGITFWRLVIYPKANSSKTATIQKGTVEEELILTGEVSADDYASLAFASSGKLAWVGVAEGDMVKKGATLARLDATVAAQDVKITDATLREEAATLDRVYDTLGDKAGKESFAEKETRTTAETAKDRAVFSHIKAQNILSTTTLTSPFDGIVTYIANPFAGINVIATQPQIEVVNPETLYFDVTADQSEVLDLTVGQKVGIVLDSLPDSKLEGEISFISFAPKVGEVGTAYKVKVKFVGEIDSQKIRIGMTGDATIYD